MPQFFLAETKRGTTSQHQQFSMTMSMPCQCQWGIPILIFLAAERPTIMGGGYNLKTQTGYKAIAVY